MNKRTKILLAVLLIAVVLWVFHKIGEVNAKEVVQDTTLTKESVKTDTNNSQKTDTIK